MITNRIYEWARTQPDKTALIYNDVPFSYAVFARAIEATRVCLQAHDLPAGQTAVVVTGHLQHAWLLVMALRSLGLNTICVQSLTSAEVLDIRNIACIVAPEIQRAGLADGERIFAGARAISVPASIYLRIAEGDIPQPVTDAPPCGGHILYTSGTTGTYKKILRLGRDEEKRYSRLEAIDSIGCDTVLHAADFGLWTAFGFNTPLVAWHAGGSVVMDQRAGKFDNFFRHGINKTWLTAPLLDQLLHAQSATARPRADLDLGVGGGFLPLALAEGAARSLTPRLTVSYGSTECSMVARYRFSPDNDYLWMTPLDDSRIEIVDPEGRPCPPGIEGELRVLPSDIDATSYLDDPDASAKVFRDGYFYPGDMAVRRADGRIRILGRTADVLVVRGAKIAVAPVEQKLEALLGARAVCLFTGLGDDGREEIVIAIEADRAPSQTELDAVGREFKAFERVRFEVFEEFPRTEAGMQKINRVRLRELVFGTTGLE